MPSSLRIFLLFAYAAMLCGVSLHAQTILRVVDYNIARGVGVASSDVAAQPYLGKIVKHLAPDIWTINELGGSSPEYNRATMKANLAAFIDTYGIFGPGAVEGQNYFIYIGERTDGYITQAIVSRYPFLSTQTYSDAGGGFPALRGLTSAHIDIPGSVEIGVFTAHLKALNATSDAEKRQAQSTANAATLSTWLAANPNAAAVMTGDFNESEEPGDPDNWSGANTIGSMLPSGAIYRPITTIRDAGFADAKPASIAGNRDTIDSVSPDTRFDYIMHRESNLIFLNGQVFDTKQHSAAQLAALNAASGANFVAGDSSAASDHLPVLELFLVSPGPAYIAAQSATGLASTSAVLNTTVNPNGLSSTVRFEIGTTSAYGATSIAQSLAAGTTNLGASLNAAGLAPATTYHFRTTAQNSAGTSVGADQTFTTPAFVDTDSDGMANDWESANGFNPNSGADAAPDTDGDGMSNRDEYLAGTNPRDFNSGLRVNSVVRAGADIAVTWPSVFGKRYQLQGRSSLASGSWSIVANNVAGTGGAITILDPGASVAAQRFYRLVTQP
jgi:endonuclease/exonuclease/phosphatase family metal-dependent hydrolase